MSFEKPSAVLQVAFAAIALTVALCVLPFQHAQAAADVIGKPVPIVPPVTSYAMTIYVSKAGNNSNGQSWATAYNELNQIPWRTIGSAVAVTVCIDGGPPVVIDPRPGGSGGVFYPGMTYNTPLDIEPLELPPGAGGGSPPGNGPVQILVSTDPAHKGQVSINVPNSLVAITINRPNVTISGIKRSGIKIMNFQRYGVVVEQSATLNGLEIQGQQTSQSVMPPSQGGVYVPASNYVMPTLYLMHSIIHDTRINVDLEGKANAQVNDCWIYNSYYQDVPVAGPGPVPIPAKPPTIGVSCGQSASIPYNPAYGVQVYPPPSLPAVPTIGTAAVYNSLIGPGLDYGVTATTFHTSSVTNCMITASTQASFYAPLSNLTLNRISSYLPPVNPFGGAQECIYNKTTLRNPPPVLVGAASQNFFANNSSFFCGNIVAPIGQHAGVKDIQFHTTGNTAFLSNRILLPSPLALAMPTDTASLMQADYSFVNGGIANQGSSITSLAQLMSVGP